MFPKYIFTSDPTDARVAAKYVPDCITLFPVLPNPDAIYESFMNHLTDLKKVYESLMDEESKKTFRGYWLGSISQNFNELVYANTQHYILEGFIPKRDDIFIDVGACYGDTASYFSEMGYKVYAFEMDKKNFEKAKLVAEEKHFVLENFGLGSYKHEMRYTPQGGMSRFNPNGTEIAKITTLDAYVRENDLPRVDFIKFDVEGAELDVLQGATSTIARDKPILAISAYHKWNDFWTLMNFVKSIRSDYEFAMRQYRSSLEDLPPSDQNIQLENFLYSL
ncbi:MAG: FkbM family methyltransferase, partial [Selenomonadaceae bacterium]|nr:FkbM family methyltransferase [Selenomonadaceae bacterium]